MRSKFNFLAAHYRREVAAVIAFVIVLLVTVFVWQYLQSIRMQQAKNQFLDMASVQQNVLINRARDYEQVLLGAAGMFAASESVERSEWREYVNSLRLHLTLPGIEGVGYAQMVAPKDKPAHEAAVRSQGFPNYAIYPAGERDMYSSIIYLEPFSGRNLKAFSYDMFSEPVRHEAMQRAADTRNPAWSGKVKLVQEEGQSVPQAGFLVYVPIYAKNMPLNTVQERRAALQGFVYSPFRAGDMLGQLYMDPNRQFELQLFDGPVKEDHLLFTTEHQQNHHALFSVDLPIDLGGALWTARFRSNEKFSNQVLSRLPLVVLLTVLGMEALVFVSFMLDARNRRSLLQSTAQLELSNREVRLLVSLTQLLQNCTHESEYPAIVSSIFGELFPNAAGAWYVLNASENQLVNMSQWGAPQGACPEYFEPDACWAYRRGQIHCIGHHHVAEVRCTHVPKFVDKSICAPLLAQGKVIGTLFLMPNYTEVRLDEFYGRYTDLLSSVADTISLSLSNLRLRNSLRDMAIQDVLTGLYNRRYMQESLEREIERAHRQHHTIALVMLDVDWFKKLNDAYGHDAGDVMLKSIADQLKRFRRGIDVVCRYGGEEFLLLLPEIPSQALSQRLETLLHDIQSMKVRFADQDLPSVTVSMGVACYPQDSEDALELIRLADAALYRAKNNGRNRVESHDGVL